MYDSFLLNNIIINIIIINTYHFSLLGRASTQLEKNHTYV